MENKQIFMFFADVVALAARHFGESPQAAPADPRPPESPAGSALPELIVISRLSLRRSTSCPGR